GAHVTVVSGPARTALPQAAEVVKVRTAAEMRRAMLKAFPASDICIMAAAVSDYRPVRTSRSKIRRVEGVRTSLALESTPDILAELGKRKGGRILVGFALETGSGTASARRKMAEKRCDIMAVNRAGQSLERDSTKITVIDAGGGAVSFPVMTKSRAAALIIRRIAARLRH
ncbi:MAG: phosphopantothenoylcysteine decarboxylase, partial [Chitinispirillaceae bacterium]|nr:phosphopantothenoylcysteine decarboxylase [Chitinispirillaceae bacterium]